MGHKFAIDRKLNNTLQSLGVPVKEALIASNIPENFFTYKKLMLETGQYLEFMSSVGDLSGDDCLAVRLGTMDGIEALSPPIFAAYCSSNAFECFNRIAAYKKLVGPMIINVKKEMEYISVELDIEGEEYEVPSFLVALDFVFLIHITRKATGVHVVPLEITSKEALNNEAYNEFFGIPPTRGKKNILRIKVEDGLRDFKSENENMWEYFEPELNKRLMEMESQNTFEAKLKRKIVDLLHEGKTSIHDVAQALDMSSRTLQRKLRDEGTTFQQQLNQARELMAKEYLNNPGILIDDIAYLLGYGEVNSFKRSFNKWTGQTINAYKKDLEGDQL